VGPTFRVERFWGGEVGCQGPGKRAVANNTRSIESITISLSRANRLKENLVWAPVAIGGTGETTRHGGMGIPARQKPGLTDPQKALVTAKVEKGEGPEGMNADFKATQSTSEGRDGVLRRVGRRSPGSHRDRRKKGGNWLKGSWEICLVSWL